MGLARIYFLKFNNSVFAISAQMGYFLYIDGISCSANISKSGSQIVDMVCMLKLIQAKSWIKKPKISQEASTLGTELQVRIPSP